MSPLRVSLQKVFLEKRNLNRIKVVLAEKNRTAVWLAKQLGKGKGTVWKWSSNSVQPSLETLFEIARILDVEVRELIVATKS